MKRLLLVSLPLFLFALTGCNSDSTELPVDGRYFDGVRYSEPGRYSGVVMNSYLRDARVWLDLDGDGQYTSGPVTVTLKSGKEVVIEGGEPTVMSEAGGVFTLDTSELVRDPLEAPDLDPRDYPLMALAIPGTTVAESAEGDRLISKAYLLAAPAGVRNVTPLTSLLFSRRLGGASAEPGDRSMLAEAFRGINLKGDYIKGGNIKAQVYAAAMARFLASQFPEEYSAALHGSDGTQRGLTLKSGNLLWVSFANSAADIIQVVEDAVPSGRYQNVNVAELPLPVVDLDLSNPYILRSQVVYASGQLPRLANSLSRSAELVFDYDVRGRLSAISAKGCMSPPMQEIARLANAGGYIEQTGIQWLPGVSLSDDSSGYLDAEKISERLVFDWENKTATFDTTTTCETGVASVSELGGVPARTYRWQTEFGKVTVTDTDTRMSLGPGQAGPAYHEYTKWVDDELQEKVSLAAERQACEGETDAETAAASRIVSARQGYLFEGHAPQPDSFTELMLEFDDHNGTDRLLSYSFLDPDLADLPNVSAAAGFTWEFYYPPADAVLAPEQPDLISEAILVPFRAANECWSDLSGQHAGRQFARVAYTYSRLSEYLADGLE